jgi:hypothetical protein
MGLTSVTGLFSRYFAVGFFLPAYFSLLVLWIAASRGFLPDSFEGYKGATQLAVLGGIALVAALALSGLNYSILRLFEGYPLEAARDAPVIRALYGRFLAGQRRHFDRLTGVRDGEHHEPRKRSSAAWRLDRLFPHDSNRLLPTAFGNAMRAFEGHTGKRYGLDGIVAFPRIHLLLTSTEREPLVDAKIDVNVFMNAVVGAVLVGIALIVDAAINSPLKVIWVWLYLLPFVVAYVLYKPMIGAGVRWGTEVRASMDVHRLDLYAKLGVRRPTSFTDERNVAQAVNYLLVYGVPVDDALWRAEEPNATTIVDPPDVDVARLMRQSTPTAATTPRPEPPKAPKEGENRS